MYESVTFLITYYLKYQKLIVRDSLTKILFTLYDLSLSYGFVSITVCSS